MASDIWLRTILIVRKETHCRHIGYSFWLTARVLLYAPSHRQDSTYHGLCYTSRGALAGMRNSSMGSPHEGSISQWGRCVSVVAHLLMVPQVSCFSLQPVLHNWHNKCCGIYKPVCEKVHLLLLIWKSSRSSSTRFPLLLFEWSCTICPTPFNHFHLSFNLVTAQFDHILQVGQIYHTLRSLFTEWSSLHVNLVLFILYLNTIHLAKADFFFFFCPLLYAFLTSVIGGHFHIF